MFIGLTVLAMSEQEKRVVLQADIRESVRTRLKLQAVQLGTTMSNLVDRMLDEALKQLEEKQG